MGSRQRQETRDRRDARKRNRSADQPTSAQMGRSVGTQRAREVWVGGVCEWFVGVVWGKEEEEAKAKRRRRKPLLCDVMCSRRDSRGK